MQPDAYKNAQRMNMRSKTVLLVDDEATILVSLGDYLTKSGFSVETVPNGQDALDAVQATSFDFVITDLVMGEIDGLTLLQEVKKINVQCCVFILTGNGNMGAAIAALRAGADDFILKPCDADELIMRMERSFERQEALRRVLIYEKFLPICMYCKKIRDDGDTLPGKGAWLDAGEYLSKKGGLCLSHGCCPDCYDKHRAD